MNEGWEKIGCVHLDDGLWTSVDCDSQCLTDGLRLPGST